MKNLFTITLIFISFLSFGQEVNFDQINFEVEKIESASSLRLDTFDLNENKSANGSGILKVWQNKKHVCKIVEEIGLDTWLIRITVYLQQGKPIKVIQKEEVFGENQKDKLINETSYVYDWTNQNAMIVTEGKESITSEESSSIYKMIKSILELAYNSTTAVE